MTTLSSSSPAALRPWREDAATISLVGVAHSMSHFSQLLLATLFPWLKDAFAVSYAELGLLMTVFFVVSCIVQAVSGFVVDRRGPVPVVLLGLALIGVAALGMAASTHYAVLLLWSAVAGVGNGVFHPADFTLLNRKVIKQRLGHAYSVHGVTGTLGWAIAPALLVPVTVATGSWRMGLVAAAVLVFAVLALVWWHRDRLALPEQATRGGSPGAPAAVAAPAGGGFDFLRIPAVWMCCGFFFVYACAFSGIQSFAPEAARLLHDMDKGTAAMCLSAYMVCSAIGMLAGGFLVQDPARSERVVGIGFALAAAIALTIAVAPVPGALVPVLFGLMGAVTGMSGPSRDVIVKRATPDNASGRVYGVVYSGLDIGQAVAPLLYGALMDHGHPAAVWFTIAAVQATLIVTAFNVGRARRTPAALQPA